MLLIDCPWCGSRPEIEFHYGGEAHVERHARPAELSDAAWAAFLYERTNPRGRHAERWQHIHGCRRFFNIVRDTPVRADHACGSGAGACAESARSGPLRAALHPL